MRTSPDAARQARQVYFCAFLAKVAVTPAHRRWYQSPHTSHPSISRPPGCRHKQNWPSSLSGGSPVPSRSAVAALIDCRMSLSAVTESSTAIAWTPALLRGRMRSLRSRSDHADDAAAAAASSTPSSDLSGRPSPAACISRTSAMAGRSSVLSLAAARRSACAMRCASSCARDCISASSSASRRRCPSTSCAALRTALSSSALAAAKMRWRSAAAASSAARLPARSVSRMRAARASASLAAAAHSESTVSFLTLAASSNCRFSAAASFSSSFISACASVWSRTRAASTISLLRAASVSATMRKRRSFSTSACLLPPAGA